MTGIMLYDHASSICSQMARLALVEKGLRFERRQIDIMDTHEQFQPWYVALNPRAVVPTLQLNDEIVTDTITIVNRVQALDGPDLSGDATAQDWLRRIMAPHYGVLLYRNRLDADGTAPQVVARGRYLERMRRERPDIAGLIGARLEGNRRFHALLRDPGGIAAHVADTRALVDAMAQALQTQPFIAGPAYSLADCFATAALARFTIHGFSDWWLGTPVEAYYSRMKARPGFAAAQVIDTGTERDL